MKYIKLKPFLHRFMMVSLFVGFAFWLYQPYTLESNFSSWFFVGWVFILAGFLWILPKWFQTVFGTLSLSILSLDLWVQTVYFRAFGQYGRLSTFLSSSDALANSWDSVEEFLSQDDWRYLGIVLLFLALSILLNLLSSKVRKKTYIGLLLGFMLTSSYGYLQIQAFTNALAQDKQSIDGFQYYKTIDYIYTTVPNTLSFVENFGVFGLLGKDIYEQIIEPIAHNTKEENEAISAYLSERSMSEPNDFTGILEGKSVLMIEAESLIQAAIDPVLTPTLYRLQTYGYSFTNYNSPLLPGSTSDTELMANTSLLPVNTGENTFMNYADNVYPVSLAQVFTENDYVSMAAHNNYAEFYNRDEMLPALGYDFFDSYRMGFEGQMIPDSEFLSPIKWISIERDKFFSYWITFNGHQPYSLEDMNPLFQHDYDWVSELYPTMPEAEKVYLAKTMDLDRALGSLIIDFTNSGRIDDLVIVLFGDHMAKGPFTDQETVNLLCDGTVGECTQTPLIIWNNDQFVGQSDKVSNPLDILPTTFDLMGFEYNQSFVLGHSLFDEAYSGFYFNDFGDLVFKDFTYNSVKDVLNIPSNLPMDEVQKQIDDAYNLMNLGSLIVENNYFNSTSCQSTFETCQP